MLRDPNHDFCLTDVVEWVRVTSPLAEADRPYKCAVTTLWHCKIQSYFDLLTELTPEIPYEKVIPSASGKGKSVSFEWVQ